MEDKIKKRIAKIKSQIRLLEYAQVVELFKWVEKKKDEMWREVRIMKIKEKEDEVRSLPIGAKVVFKDARYEICGTVGKIIKHLGRGSNRTSVDFGKKGTWRVPSRELSADTKEEHIKQLIQNKKLSHVLNRALTGITARPIDRRVKCRACWQRLEKGQSRRFLHQSVFKAHGVRRYMTLHKHRKDCGKKSEWTKRRNYYKEGK